MNRTPESLTESELEHLRAHYGLGRECLESAFRDWNAQGIKTYKDRCAVLLRMMRVSEKDYVFFEEVEDSDRYEALIGTFFSGVWRNEEDKEEDAQERANALHHEADQQYAKYCKEREKLELEWEEGTPYPLRSELDDTSNLVWVAVRSLAQYPRVLGVFTNFADLVKVVDKHSETPGKMSEWHMLPLKLIGEI